MLSLPELSQAYKNSHPHYINPLAYFDVTDHELADLKREALFPYLENLEEKMVIYRARMIAFVVLFDVECDERGFRANVWRLNIIHLPEYAKRLAEHKIWQVACTWNSIRLLDDRINCSPAGWTFWPEDRVINHVEKKFVTEGAISAYLSLQNTVNLR